MEGSTGREGAAARREPGLDGLRGVAVLAVVGFHGGIGLRGGALGVDLFLVLSGFLITALLVRELDTTGRIDLGAFWGRRLRRLLPALLAVVAVVVAHEAITGGPDPAAIRDDALATLGYVANWRFVVAGGGYFASFAAPSPLRHAWSLAVEEQWYLVWPPVLWALWRLLGRHVVVLTGVVVAAALGSAVLMARWSADLDRVHYGTDTRAQALLLGAALALVLHRRPVATWTPRTCRALARSGVAAFAVLVWFVVAAAGTEPWLYRGGHLGFAAAAAVATAATLVPGSLRRILSTRVLVWFGLVSYGLYLWHWPVFVWLSPGRTGLSVWPLFALRCLVSIGLAAISARVIERPFRTPAARLARPARAAVWATGVVAVAAILAGSMPAARGGDPLSAVGAPTLPVGFVAPAGVAAPPSPPPSAVGAALPAPVPGTPDGRLTVAVIGDSTGFTLTWDLDEPPGIDVRGGAVLGCGIAPAPIMLDGAPTVVEGDPVPCADAPAMWEHVVAAARPDVVVLTLGAWEVFDRQLPDGTWLGVGTAAWSTWLAGSLGDLGARLAAAAPGAVLAIPRVPCFDEREDWLGGPRSARNDPARVDAVNQVIDGFVAANPGRTAELPLDEWLCPGGTPAVELDGVVLRRDGVHVSPEAAAPVWRELLGPALHALVPTP